MPSREPDYEETQTTRGVVGGTKLFNRFTLQKILGRGGMGIVWLAQDERLDRLVALKLVPETVCFDPAAQEDLKRETRKSLMLTHPNIVRIFDFVEDERTAGISMEYVDGAALSYLRVQKSSRCFEVDELSPWVTSLCEALTYAHDSARVIHRDLKPGNLMTNSRSELKITDFGIACTLRESMNHVSVRSSSGTLNYMSPQQMLGEDPSPADDIYAMGASIYELLTSKPPFYGGDVASQVREVLAPTMAERRAKFEIKGITIPKQWEETIAACLAKEVERRPRTAAEVARRLRLGGPIRIAKAEEGKVWWKKIPPRLAAEIAALLIIGAFFLLGRHHSRTAPPRPAMVAETKPVSSARGYAMETSTPANSNNVSVLAASPTLKSAPAATASPASEPPHPTSKRGSIQFANPAGAAFAIYPGIVAAPAETPLRSGAVPGLAEQLPGGDYTVFFHREGWPDERAEIFLHEGETLPVQHDFAHGIVAITSAPSGAEIFLGETSLGVTPLSVDLPPGRQELKAKLGNYPERTQTISLDPGASSNIAFQMRTGSNSSHSRKAKPTPTPSLFSKMGESLKHVFGPKPTPTPRKRHK